MTRLAAGSNVSPPVLNPATNSELSQGWVPQLADELLPPSASGEHYDPIATGIALTIIAVINDHGSLLKLKSDSIST